MSHGPVPLERTALLVCDLQNDFIHPEGAYARGGQSSPEIAAIPARVKPLADVLRAHGGFVVSTHFTLVPGRGGEPMISPHLKAIRPFLRKGDFLPGAWGHQLVDELAPADFCVEKVAYSAFYMTRLEWVLRDLETVLLSDGCAAFSAAVHDTAVAALRPVCPVMTVAEALAELSGLAGPS